MHITRDRYAYILGIHIIICTATCTDDDGFEYSSKDNKDGSFNREICTSEHMYVGGSAFTCQGAYFRERVHSDVRK